MNRQNYPIDIESFVQEVRNDMGNIPGIEEFTRSYAFAINKAYHAGKEGKEGYPIDPEKTIPSNIQTLETAQEKAELKRIYFDAVRLINSAYADGVRDAMEEKEHAGIIVRFLIAKALEREEAQSK